MHKYTLCHNFFIWQTINDKRKKKVNLCDNNKNSHSQSVKQDNCGKICLFMYSISMIGGGEKRVKMASKAFNKLA